MRINSLEPYNQMVERVFPNHKPLRSITFQVTEACNLRCTYCYQHNKNENIMSFETAKVFIDMLLENNNEYINQENSGGMIIEFIGGEPIIAIDVIDKITEYILERLVLMNHPWLYRTVFNICSNGTMYFNEKFQNYLKKYSSMVSFSISLDGNKELHDSCRMFPNGEGSYDMAFEAVKHYRENYNESIGSKMTLSPFNIKYTFEALKNLVELGYDSILANCVFEEGWNENHAATLYYELKKISDYLFENNLEEEIFISLFAEDSFIFNTSDCNWCGGNGEMIAINPSGKIYPCIRYMESSLGDDVPPIIIGDIQNGIGKTEEAKNWISQLKKMNRKNQSTDECINCPISLGCAWCSGYNYEYYKQLGKRATFICLMHKARALANIYFWNKYYIKHNESNVKELLLPKEECLRIIPEKEYNLLVSLESNNKNKI